MGKVYFAAIMYSFITGLSFLFGKVGLEYSNPMDLLAYRFAAAFIAIFIPVVFKLVDVEINKSMIKRILPMTLFYPLGFFAFQLFGLKYTPSSGTSFLTNYVLSYMESSKMSVFSNLATVISIVAGVVFLKEDIFYYHIIGSILIIIGVIGANVFGIKEKESL